MGLKALFIQNLKKIRKRRGLSQMVLAEMCNSSTSYIGQIEIGNRFPSVEMLEKMARALQIQPYLFFFDENDPESGKPLPETVSAIPETVKEELVGRLTRAISQIIRKA
jgi:transcriptional regulator with XRE-family HTH domain